MKFPYLPLFSSQWITFGFFLTLILSLIGLAESARSRHVWSNETSRKLIHVLVGTMVACCPFLFSSNLPPMLLAGLFIVINLAALKSNHFRAIHATARKSYGTVYFPLAFLILAGFWWSRPVALSAGILLMTFSDTLASITGQNVSNPREYRIWTDKKSVEGSTIFFLSAFIIISVLYISLGRFTGVILPAGQILGLAAFVSLVATLAESASRNGSDNLTVPLSASIAFDLYLGNYSTASLYTFMLWVLGSGVMFYLVLKSRALSRSGGVAAFLMGIFIFGSGGIAWITPMAVFFISSSAISRFRKDNRHLSPGSSWNNHQKGTRRDLLQVTANGGVAMTMAIVYFYTGPEWLYGIFLGAVAAATADTWATEIGYHSTGNPRHIISFQTVPKGTSGGISLVGTLGTLAGAAVIGLTGYLFGITPVRMLVIILAGCFGSLVDSILGGTVQATFRCPVCKSVTENRRHCHSVTEHHHGVAWIDNDMVNLLGTASGALLVAWV